MSATLPASLPIEPRGPLDARIRVPGSKSITNRALPLAALAEGESELAGCLVSDDTQVMCTALRVTSKVRVARSKLFATRTKASATKTFPPS